jgi:hypothetical protein
VPIVDVEDGRAEALGYVNRYRRAVWLQHMRVLADATDAPDNREVDFTLFAVALRDLRRAVELVRRVAPRVAWSDIDLALNAFDAVVPHTEDLRDVLEHFDAYATGDGKLQKGKELRPESPVTSWTESRPGHYSMTVAVAPGAPLLTVEVNEATVAAAVLAVTVVDACKAALDAG